MDSANTFDWLRQGGRRSRMVSLIWQPLTIKQLAHHASLRRDSCGHVVWELAVHHLMRCLNDEARRSRVYWLTRLGQRYQRVLRLTHQRSPLRYCFPRVDWSIYGWVCFSHRAAILKVLSEPLQPATIKRRARAQNPRLRMSANNARDVMKLFLERGIVTPIHVKRHAHRRYQLTELGQQLRELVISAEAGPPLG